MQRIPRIYEAQFGIPTIPICLGHLCACTSFFWLLHISCESSVKLHIPEKSTKSTGRQEAAALCGQKLRGEGGGGGGYCGQV